jgi:hypothetical protein
MWNVLIGFATMYRFEELAPTFMPRPHTYSVFAILYQSTRARDHYDWRSSDEPNDTLLNHDSNASTGYKGQD